MAAVNSMAFRQICDKPCSSSVQTMRWSPKNDLIAILTIDGEIRLHRLYWSKVWSLSEKTVKYTAVAWNPDGTILAAGSEDGQVKLFEIEKCQCIYTNSLCSKITCIEWIQAKNKSMSLMIAGTENGQISLFVNGMFKIANTHQTANAKDVSVSNLHISASFLQLFTVHSDGTEDENESNCISVHEIKLLSTRADEIAAVAAKFERIDQLMNKFDTELTKVSESWENILQKITSKLCSFSKGLPADTCVSDEFLMAFTCGQLSPDLQGFLFHDLTTKGLRKLGTDVNTSYANIKSIVVNAIQTLCYDLSFELTELLGMARWYGKYGILGLCEKTVQASQRCLGTFMLKIRELGNLIDRDLKSFRAFFKWLSGVMVRASDDPLPNSFKEFSQEDNAHILYFVRTQLVENEGKGSFMLERVGQYVQKGNLHIKQDQLSNPWYKYVNDSAVLKDSPLIILPDDSRSLLDISTEMQQNICKIFTKVTSTVTESFVKKGKTKLPNRGSSHEVDCKFRISWLSEETTDRVTTCYLPCCCNNNVFYVFTTDRSADSDVKSYSCSVDICNIPSEEKFNCSHTVIKDISFYDQETITLLIKENKNDPNPTRILAQLPTEYCFKNEPKINEFASSDKFSYDVSSHITKWRTLNAFDPVMMSVSGIRRVSCLLSKNKRRVLIFDMDADGEEEDEEEEEDEDDCDMEAE